MKKKYDVKKVSRETLEKLAEEVISSKERGVGSYTFSLIDDVQPSMVRNTLKEAEVPLRTKAEVDADIATCMRRYGVLMDKYEPGQNLLAVQGFAHGDGTYDWPGQDLVRLLNEETSD